MEISNPSQQLDRDQELLRKALLAGGAIPNALGRLVLTPPQVEFIQLNTTEPEPEMSSEPETPVPDAELTEITPEIEAWLGMSIEQMLHRNSSEKLMLQQRSVAALEKGGIVTVRHLLVAGALRDETVNFGPTYSTITKAALEANPFGIKLKDQRSKNELALLCHDLNLVSVGAALKPIHPFRRLTLARVQNSTIAELTAAQLASLYLFADKSDYEKAAEHKRTQSEISALKLAVKQFVDRLHST